MITDALQQLAGLFSRRFFFNALLPTFIFTTFVVSTAVASWWTIGSASVWWGQLDLLSRLLVVLAYIALVYFFAAAMASQWRNIVRLFEGYPLLAIASRLKIKSLIQRWHQERMDQLQEEDEEKAYFRYPSEIWVEAILPTRLGNILLAGERYAEDRYGIDTIYFWPRLFPLLPEALQRDFDEAVIQYQFPLVVAFESTISTILCAATLLITHGPAIMFIVILLGGAAITYGAYNLSLSSAMEMAEIQKSAFDLYRDRLLTAWPSVADVKDERVAFMKIKGFVVMNAPPDWERPHADYVNRHRDDQGPR